jgi:hypothetical protein
MHADNDLTQEKESELFWSGLKGENQFTFPLALLQQVMLPVEVEWE